MKQYTATTNDDGVRLSRFVQSAERKASGYRPFL